MYQDSAWQLRKKKMQSGSLAASLSLIVWALAFFAVLAFLLVCVAEVIHLVFWHHVTNFATVEVIFFAAVFFAFTQAAAKKYLKDPKKEKVCR